MARQSPVSKDAGFLHAIIERDSLAHGNAQGFGSRMGMRGDSCSSEAKNFALRASLLMARQSPVLTRYASPLIMEATTARITTPVSRVTATGIRSMRILDTASLFLWSWVLSYDQIINDERSLLH